MSLLDQARKLEQQLLDRLKELEPLTREYDRLRKLAERLGVNYTPSTEDPDDDTAPPARAPTPATAPARKRSAKTAGRARKPRAARPPARKQAAKPAAKTGAAKPGATKPRAAKPRAPKSRAERRSAAAPGQRQDDVLRLVGEQPGITVRELGERLEVDSTGLYRIVKRLADEGRVRKDGPRVHPVEPAAPAGAPAANGDAAQTPAASAPASDGDAGTES